MATPSQGAIVWAEILDPQNRNLKRHPIIVITSNDEITGECEELVGVVASHTASLTIPRPRYYVPLPYNPGGKCCTKFKKETVAVCNWLVKIANIDYETDDIGGYIPKTILLDIIEQVVSFHSGLA